MNIQLLSDLHFEFHDDHGNFFIKNLDSTDVDVLILAGDITTCKVGLDPLRQICDKYPLVLKVLGNHYFYHGDFHQSKEDILNNSNLPSNLYILENKFFHYYGKQFIGCSLWFPDQAENHRFRFQLNDFNYIKSFGDVYKRNTESIKFLSKHIDKDSIVITHHLPSIECIPEQFKYSDLNRFYYTEMKEVIVTKKPAYWFFGHTHCSVSKIIHHTKVISNPYGYHEREVNPNFNNKLVFTI